MRKTKSPRVLLARAILDIDAAYPGSGPMEVDAKDWRDLVELATMVRKEEREVNAILAAAVPELPSDDAEFAKTFGPAMRPVCAADRESTGTRRSGGVDHVLGSPFCLVCGRRNPCECRNEKDGES